MTHPAWISQERHTLLELWEEAVEQCPETVFLHFLADGTKYTYAQFDELSNRLAQGLLASGVAPGDRIATLLDSHADSVALLLAASKVRAVYVPVNTANKGEFLRNPLANSGASLLVSEAKYLERVSAIRDALPDLKDIYVRGENPEPSEASAAFSELYLDNSADTGIRPLPEDIAGIIYTGGTTGPSKGCILSQNYIANQALRTLEMCDPRPGEVNWTCLPLFHLNAIVVTILYSVVSHTTAAITPRFSLSSFWSDIEESGASVASVLGSMIPLIANLPDSEEMLRCKGQLRMARGAPFPGELQDIWKDRFGVEIAGAHVYGLTESSFLSMLTYEDAADAPPGSSGKRNHRDFEVMIVNDDFEEVPAGHSGEVVVRPKRPNVMFEGYWGRPQETLDVFAGLWFHTGDIGQFDENDFFYFVDRKKDYLRRRGENISSYEMETTFALHPDINEVAVHAVPSALTEDDIKVTVVKEEGSTLTEPELALWAIDNVPYYAVPRYIEFRSQLPKNPVGRILKGELREEGCTASTWDLEESDISYKKA
ncbi:MAG: AMP-binding protein [Pseudomonadota bacterium]